MYILDTDHISLFQRNDPHVSARVLMTPSLQLAATVVTVEEQLRGRLDRIRRARNDEQVVRAYQSLHATVLYFRTISIIGFDQPTQTIFRTSARRRSASARKTYGLRLLPFVRARLW